MWTHWLMRPGLSLIARSTRSMSSLAPSVIDAASGALAAAWIVFGFVDVLGLY